MLKINNKENCCGCTACVQSCPKKCIIMVRDDEGFEYPKINELDCIECRKCLNVCPILNKERIDKETLPKAFAAYNLDKQVRLQSSSGGIFSALAEKMIMDNGIVFGPRFSNSNKVLEHSSVESVSKLESFRGSKYLQSSKNDAFEETENLLKQGKKVLFTGTACEIAGLKKYLGIDYENLLTQDIICHGVSSPKLWEKYVSYQESINNAKTIRINFRDKKKGWKKYGMFLEFENNKKYRKVFSEDKYMKMFLNNLSLRPSCYNCSFKSINRDSDITLADFWGCDLICSNMNDDKGLSLVIVHSIKGLNFLNSILDKIIIKEVDFVSAIKENPAISRSCNKPNLRDNFMTDIDKLDINQLNDKYIPKQSILRKIKWLLPTKFVRYCKKIYYFSK